MPQAYSDPKREDSPTALPDVEYWFANEEWCERNGYETSGWYWWPCFPGCMPDSDPSGPFETEAECIADFTAECEEGSS